MGRTQFARTGVFSEEERGDAMLMNEYVTQEELSKLTKEEYDFLMNAHGEKIEEIRIVIDDRRLDDSEKIAKARKMMDDVIDFTNDYLVLRGVR